MDYFNDVLATFLDVNCSNYIAVCGGSESSRDASKISKLCLEDERRSHGFGTTRG